MKTKNFRSTRKTAPALAIKSILVPLDFSPSSQATLKVAAEFARQFKARLTLLHVIEPVLTPDFTATVPMALEDDQAMTAARKQLEAAVEAAGIPAREVEKIMVRIGRSFHEITDAARTRKADLIVISTHGYTGLKHAVLGSTTERVVRYAPCPVFVVRCK